MDILKTVEFEIGGNKYKTSVMPATEGRVLFLAFVKAVAPALEKMSIDPGSDPEKKSAMLMAAAANVIAQLDPVVLEMFCDCFGKQTYHVMGPTQMPQMDRGYFGLHFAGRYVEMMKWLLECCRINGFFSFLPGN